MRSKILILILIIVTVCFAGALIINSDPQVANKNITESTDVKSEEVGQDISNFFDSEETDIEQSITITPANKPKCKINGNVVESGTVVDNTTCVGD